MVVGDEADYCCDVDESKERKIREIELSQKGVFFFFLDEWWLLSSFFGGGSRRSRKWEILLFFGCSLRLLSLFSFLSPHYYGVRSGLFVDGSLSGKG